MITFAEIAALRAVAEDKARPARKQVMTLLRQVAGGPEAWVTFEAADRELAILAKLQLELTSTTTP